MKMHKYREQENPSLDLEFCPLNGYWRIWYLPTLQNGCGSTPNEAKKALFDLIRTHGIGKYPQYNKHSRHFSKKMKKVLDDDNALR